MSNAGSARRLFSQCQAGDLRAAEGIYLRYAERLWRLADRHIGETLQRRVDPDDIVQTVFRTFFRRTEAGKFSIENSASLWALLARITLNRIRSEARKWDLQAAVPLDDGREQAETSPGPPTEAGARMLLQELSGLVAQLDPRGVEVLRLTVEGLSVSQIAGQLGCSRWTIRRVLDRVGAMLTRQWG
jgi:RNA polymerase sigma-70 factor (ECF subfamily)